MALRLSSTAIAALLVAAPPAGAQTPPTYDPIQYGLALIQAPAAWSFGYVGTGVTIAVGDTGISANQIPTGFSGVGKIDSRSMNFVLPSPGAAYDPSQIADLGEPGHGTHVSGISLGSADSLSPGVAYAANVVMLRILTGPPCNNQNCSAPGVPDPFVASLNYFADLSNVRIYNASWGPSFYGSTGLKTWSAECVDPDLAAATLNTVSKGKIVVAATGNDRQDNPVAGQSPNGLALYPFIRPGANAHAGVYDAGTAPGEISRTSRWCSNCIWRSA